MSRPFAADRQRPILGCYYFPFYYILTMMSNKFNIKEKRPAGRWLVFFLTEHQICRERTPNGQREDAPCTVGESVIQNDTASV